MLLFNNFFVHASCCHVYGNKDLKNYILGQQIERRQNAKRKTEMEERDKEKKER